MESSWEVNEEEIGRTASGASSFSAHFVCMFPPVFEKVEKLWSVIARLSRYKRVWNIESTS